MNLVTMLFLEKHLIRNMVVLSGLWFNSYTYTSIVIFMNQLAEGFQTWETKTPRKGSGI